MTHSFGGEFGSFDMPIMRKPSVQKATTIANEKLWRSTCDKNPINRLGYNDYMAYHYAFMMAIVQEKESFFEAAKDPQWV